nr:hypothetical protein [uncultured Blautia sp.]
MGEYGIVISWSTADQGAREDNISDFFHLHTRERTGTAITHTSRVPNLESIRALRELNMSIGEIKEYLNRPTAPRFISLSEKKNRGD